MLARTKKWETNLGSWIGEGSELGEGERPAIGECEGSECESTAECEGSEVESMAECEGLEAESTVECEGSEAEFVWVIGDGWDNR